MRKRIKVTGFSDWDSMFYNNLLSIPVLLVFSLVIEDWGSANLDRNLYVSTCPSAVGSLLLTCTSLPTGRPNLHTWAYNFCRPILGCGPARGFFYFPLVVPRGKVEDAHVRRNIV